MANVKAFNAYQEEVKAILAGRQTQFRRVMKFPQWALDYKSEEELAYLLNTKGNVGLSRDGRTYRWFSSGYGFVGDYLYVRETFRLSDWGDCACDHSCECKSGMPIYMATWECDDCNTDKWIPSSRMPRELSRIMFKIKSIKVERLNCVQACDAIAEGIAPASLFGYDCDTEADKWNEYIDRWNSKNRENTWSDDPWTVVVGFEVVKSKNGVVIS